MFSALPQEILIFLPALADTFIMAEQGAPPPSPPDPKEFERLRNEVERLQKENERLREELKKKDAQIEELLRGLKRQAAPYSKGAPQPNPQRPGRKPGRAYGLKGHRPRPCHVDEVYDAPLPARCPSCGSSALHPNHVEPQFQVEIPRKPLTRQFNIAFGHCDNCGRPLQGRHPLQTSDAVGAAASQLGPEAQALVVHLNKEAGLSHGKIARLFQVVFGISLTRGGSAQVMLRAANACRPHYCEIFWFVRSSSTVYGDETGWKVGGVLQWLWAFVTLHATLYLIRPCRGHDVPEEVLGAEFAGRFGHDGWSPYDFFAHACHQQCNAHLLRRCVYLLESATRGAVRFPRAVQQLLQQGLHLRDRRDARGLSAHGLAVATGRLEARLDRLVHARPTHPGNARFARHLARHQDEIFPYLRDSQVEPTNWRGEHAMRAAVVLRKVWGGSRTEHGAEAQAILTSVLRTCWQQGKDSLSFLAETLRAPPHRLPALFSG